MMTKYLYTLVNFALNDDSFVSLTACIRASADYYSK